MTAVTELRARRPLVHNITNYVAMTLSANVLLALGASPAMVHAVEEVEDFAAISSALCINIGTLSPRWVEAMHLAARKAVSLGKPWVLDPVGCGATPYRTGVAAELARKRRGVAKGRATCRPSFATRFTRWTRRCSTAARRSRLSRWRETRRRVRWYLRNSGVRRQFILLSGLRFCLKMSGVEEVSDE